MAIKYTPSINILRDKDAKINYIPTPNARRVANQIGTEFKNGNRSFNIIGSYGTGKSAFLWAFSKTLKSQAHYFNINGLEDLKVEVLPLIGSYSSVTDFFNYHFGNKNSQSTPEQIFAEIFHHYHKLGKGNGLLVLMIDEFGKFLEYAAKNNPEKELFFLQQLAEFVNDPSYNIALLTTLHQNFDAYSFGLTPSQRQEWAKVKGRFKEITFNEPVEQLLFLAGERLSLNEAKIDNVKINKAANLFIQTKVFPFNPEFANQLALKLFPLDLFSASVAALSMQRYGQNERSLFSFLEGTDYTGINAFDKHTNPFYNLSNLYDYLIFNFYSFLTSKFNADYSAWSGIKGALERVENDLEGNVAFDCQKLIKAVGLLNIFASKGGNISPEFLFDYAENCLGINDPDSAVEILVDKKIFLYRNYENRFVIFEGTDIDIQGELQKADDQVGEIEDVVSLLYRHFSFPAVFAKEHYYKTGTPRIFEFIFSNVPKKELIPEEDTDGFVNLIFNEKITVEQIINFSKEQADKAILYGYYKNSSVIRNLLREIEKTRKTKENVPDDDRIAQRELSNIQEHQENLLNHYILNSLNNKGNDVVWIFAGQELDIKSKREFNSKLSYICKKVYFKAPVFHSELVNRSSLSSSIYTAKRAYYKNLVQNWEDEDLGFEKDKFPPEKTIFLSLLRENGLVFNPKNPLEEIKPNTDSSFIPLWEYGEDWLEKTKKNRLPLTNLVEGFKKPPFKLKQGLIDFWLPTFLFVKRDEFALFGNDIYIPEITEGTLELLAKNPKEFSIKAFDVKGVKLEIFNRYRQFLNQSPKEKTDNQTFIETIRPFLNFYSGLPEYAKQTKRLKKETIAIRSAIEKATDPEKTFFEDFPTALGVTLSQLKKSPELLAEYISKLQNAIREIRTCHEELINRFEVFIKNEVIYEDVVFEKYQPKIKKRFKNVKQYLLLPHHKALLMRLTSDLDDRNSWLSSIAQSVVGKTLENLRDRDEPLLFDKFKNYILELDTFSQLSNKTIDEKKEEVLSLEIITFGQVEKKVIRYPKKKKEEIKRIEGSLRTQLGNDKTLNIAALASLLKEFLKNE